MSRSHTPNPHEPRHLPSRRHGDPPDRLPGEQSGDNEMPKRHDLGPKDHPEDPQRNQHEP